MERTTSNPSRLTLGVFAAIGLAAALFGATVLRGMTTAPEGWVTANGVVVAAEERFGSDGTVYAPVVQYVVDGTTYRIVSSVASTVVPAMGDVIEVAYDPANPRDARVTGGLVSLLWLLVVGLGLVFALIPGIALLGGRSGKRPLEGYAVTDEGHDRVRFERARGNVILQLILPWVVGLGFLGFAAFLVARGLPDALFAILAGFFGVFLVLGGIAALGRGTDPRVIEVGPDGVWLPGIGQQPWDAFADVRVESFTAPTGGGSDQDRTVPVSTNRRLGLVPRDPDLASRRGLAERLGGDMGIRFYRLMTRMTGRDPIEFAPFGASEQDLGTEAFEWLTELVETYRFLDRTTMTEQPSATPSPLAEYVRQQGEDDDVSTDGSIASGGIAGAVASTAFSFLPARYRRRLWFAQLGFFVGIVLFAFVPLVRGFEGSSGAWFSLLVVGAVLLFLAVPLVQGARRVRERGESLGGPVAFLVVGAIAGAMTPALFGPGATSPGATSPGATGVGATGAETSPSPDAGPEDTIGASHGELSIPQIRGRIPDGTVSVVVGFRVNEEGAGPGWADLTIYELGLAIDDGPNLVPAPRFEDPDTVGIAWGTGRLEVEPSDREAGLMLRVAASPDENLGYNSAAVPVAPGRAFRAWIGVRAPESSDSSTNLVVVFLGSQSEIGRRVQPLHPAG